MAAQRQSRSRRWPMASRDLYDPGSNRADRVQWPAGFRADRRHAIALGFEYDQRCADRHEQQQLLRADGGSLVPFARPGRPVDICRERCAAARLCAHPAASLAGAVLPTVAGTPQANEAVISNSIPQTATVPLKNGPTFTPSFDGPPRYVPIVGTLALLRLQLLGAGDRGRAERLLRSRCRRVVHAQRRSPGRGRSPRRCRR